MIFVHFRERLTRSGARWRPLEALHVTLRFFGDIREDIARDLDTELMGVRGEGLITIALPLAMAGATLWATRFSGKLNGVMP